MRQFSELEKNIVKKLSEKEATLENQPLTNSMITFDSLVSDLSAEYNGKLIISVGIRLGIPSIEIITANTPRSDNYKKNNQMTRDVINTVNFLNYLSENHLIYFVKPDSINLPWLTPVTLGRTAGTGTDYINKIEDNSFVDMVKLFYKKHIYPTQTLINYYNNNYKTDDEIRHNANLKIASDSLKESRKGLEISEKSLEESKKSIELSSEAVKDSKININLARQALFIALMFGAISVFFSWINSENNDFKIDGDQFKTLETKLQKIEGVETKLDIILERINSTDTTITKIINFPEVD